MKMKAYTVCARAQASTMFYGLLAIQSQKIAKLLKKSERWPNKWSKVKTLEDKPRSGWPFFHKLCEKYYRKSCKYMRNNSTKQKGKKNSTSHYRSKFRAQRYGDKLPKKVGKPWREKGGAPFMQAWCQKDLSTLYQRRTGRQTHVIWTRRDHPVYRRRDNIQRSSPQNIGRAKTVTTLRPEECDFGLWELVHSIPHRLEHVRKHTGRRSGY